MRFFGVQGLIAGGLAIVPMVRPQPPDPFPDSAPKIAWTSGPALHKEGTNSWRLQGVAHWEGDASHANEFLEQDITVIYVLKRREPDGSVRAFDSGVLSALEVFPCAAAGGTATLEANDIHDYAMNLRGSVAGEISVYGRSTLGNLYYRKSDGRRGERVTTTTHASDCRYHYEEGTFAMRLHPKEPGFEFEPTSPPTYYEYRIPWDESANVSRRGHSPDRVPAGGVKQR